MKKKLTNILITVCAALAGAPACTTDAATGRRKLTPEAEASIQRIATHGLKAAETALIRQIDQSLKVAPTGKEPSPVQP